MLLNIKPIDIQTMPRYRVVTIAYNRGALGTMLVCDITERQLLIMLLVVILDWGVEGGRPVGGLPSQLTFIRLVGDGEGKLYLVGGVGNNGILRSIQVWEMGGGGNWVEVQCLPDLMCRKFVLVCYHNYEDVVNVFIC
ncbi:F-box/kelch-repeat protein [Spatholobus suberectus]|nr:F-box/kelch-repeat protein [Spatholobus suberectus]